MNPRPHPNRISSNFAVTAFIDADAQFTATNIPHPTFRLDPGGLRGPGWITLQLASDLTTQERLNVADRLVTAATKWRDELAAAAETENAIARELAEARAEITRLKGAQIGGAA